MIRIFAIPVSYLSNPNRHNPFDRALQCTLSSHVHPLSHRTHNSLWLLHLRLMAARRDILQHVVVNTRCHQLKIAVFKNSHEILKPVSLNGDCIVLWPKSRRVVKKTAISSAERLESYSSSEFKIWFRWRQMEKTCNSVVQFSAFSQTPSGTCIPMLGYLNKFPALAMGVICRVC